MARSMWRGAIQFGLVTIPVKLYLATEARGGLSFNLLHKTCLNRIQMKTHCPEHGEISRADTVRGYEWSKGQYVLIGDEDLESVPLQTVRAIEIELFVDASREANGVQFVKQAYYLEPEGVGRKAFYLLKSVLADSGLSAICKVVIKDREQLAALNPYSSTMLLSTLHWPDEVRSLADLELPEAQFEFKPAEKKMAEQLVSAMTGEFHADEYRDDYRQALMAVIEAKIGGQPAVRPEAPREDSKLVDLMSALEASVAAARQGRSAGGADKAGGGAPEAAAAEPTSMTAARRSRATKQPAGGGRAAARKAPAEREADAPAQKPQRKRKSA